MMEAATYRCAQGCCGVCHPWEGQAPGVRRSFFIADGLAGRDAQGSVVMESPPATSLVMAQPEVLLQILVVALDAPAMMGDIGEFIGGG